LAHLYLREGSEIFPGSPCELSTEGEHEMIICSLRLARISLVALTLGTLFASLALAQRAPMSGDQPEKSCSPAMSVAGSQPDLNPVGLTTPEPTPKVCGFYGMYDEFWKDGELCRWRNSCDGWQYHGTCPNGYDTHYTETVFCYCY
jgi:hypothetical protein